MQPTYNSADANARAQGTDSGRLDSNGSFQVPLEVRHLDGTVKRSLQAWIKERLGREFGKFAPQIERIEVRFEDVNGPKGGIGRSCRIHLVLSGLPPVVVEVRAVGDREAFDLAAGRAERALKRSLQKHGVSTKHKRRDRGIHGEASEAPPPATNHTGGKLRASSRRLAQLPNAHTRLTYVASEAPADGSAAPAMRDAPNPDQHTAIRNTKANAAGAYALEDSTTGKPSRRSTRGGANHIKPANPLTVRTKAAIHKPQQVAARRG